MQKNILLVEDDSWIRELYTMAFEGNNYSIDIAIDGQEALDKILNPQSKYDLILLDVMLPKVDGLTILKKIKAEGSTAKDTPVFLLTNLGQDNLIKEAMNTGAVEYLIKSNYLPKQIVEKINNYFSSLPDAAVASPDNPTQ